MEFDADWLWFAIFGGVVLVRALGGLISRARRRAEMQLPESRREAPEREELGPSESPLVVRTSDEGDQPKAIEPH